MTRRYPRARRPGPGPFQFTGKFCRGPLPAAAFASHCCHAVTQRRTLTVPAAGPPGAGRGESHVAATVFSSQLELGKSPGTVSNLNIWTRKFTSTVTATARLRPGRARLSVTVPICHGYPGVTQ